MRRKILTICLVTLALTGIAHAAKPNGCNETPLSMTFLDMTPISGAIWNDDPFVPYVHGVDGMNVRINCDSDAVITFVNSSRRAWSQFPNPIAGSIIESGPPSFAGGPPILAKIYLNVRNLSARGSGIKIPGPPATYFTRGVYAITGPDGIDYRMGYMPVNCPAGTTCVPNIHGSPFPASVNSPEQSAWVKVTYTPKSDQLDEFLIEGNFADPEIQRATLFIDGSFVHVGQYSMPFKILAKALAPLPPFTPSISISDVSVMEGNSGTQNVTFTVSLDASSDNSVSVKYATANGTAKSPADFTSKSGTVTIPAGATSTTVTIVVKGDTSNEPDETFNVNLSNPVNATIADDKGICTILNDD